MAHSKRITSSEIPLTADERKSVQRILGDSKLHLTTLLQGLVELRSWKHNSRMYDRVRQALLRFQR